jgi:hypothetical protein
MHDEELIRQVADTLRDAGYGMVVVCAFTTDDLHVKCYSTIPQSEVRCVLEASSRNLSLLPFDLASVMNGDMVVQPPNDAICEMAESAAAMMGKEEPLLVAAVSLGQFAVYGVGDVPMLIYLAVRILSFMSDSNKYMVLN